MTLFVRTQDKARLISTDCVYYEEKRKTSKVIHIDNVYEEVIESRHRLVCCNRLLGEYETKERCLEIIDEIQQKISNERTFQAITYNMPEV